ncbi:MAG: phosphoribosyltransferase family protein [Mycobacteriales bacterium]
MIFRDRADAGRRLAERLAAMKGEDAVVLALPRGGVPVAAEVARALGLPLDVVVVRKLGLPFQPEVAMGAVGEGDVVVTDDDLVAQARVGARELALVAARERREVQRRARLFREGRPPVPLAGRTALVVDDGIATGATARAACQVARALGAGRVVVAVPTGAADALRLLAQEADEVVCLDVPPHFLAVGQWYADFRQTSDEEVVALLARAHAEAPADTVIDLASRERDVRIDAGRVALAGSLAVPAGASGLVLFAHGSGSSRHSPRNREVAADLRRAGFGTLLLDLLTPAEERDRSNVFDVELLAGRLLGACDWLQQQPVSAGLPLGLFGASTGAAAALWAAAEPGSPVAAVVSRGGRPDLVRSRLPRVTAPTLLVVGGHDTAVLALNREAQALLRCESGLAVVPGASHLFEEPGALHRVSVLAGDWFLTHLARQAAPHVT